MSIDGRREAEPWVARLLLVFGGFLGIHRLYLRQLPEAFIFMSTLGVGLLGCFYDTFFFRNEVDEYNREISETQETVINEKYRKGRLQSAQSRFVRFSLSRLVFSTLYGTWIGILAWLACSISFSWLQIDSIMFIFIIAAAVSSGVYIVGKCGSQSRELGYIWISATSVAFLLIRVAHLSVFRSIFFTALISTVIGNRSAKYRRRTHSFSHFVVWSVLYAMLIIVIIIGGSRKLSDKQVTATRPGDFQETSSVGSLARDWIFDRKRVYSFFKGNPIIEYNSKHKDERSEMTSTRKTFWEGITSIVSSGATFNWDSFSVFIVDLLRCETRVVEGLNEVEPFQWAAWRLYLIYRFEMDEKSSDDMVNRNCDDWLKVNSGLEQKEHERQDYLAMATRKACYTVKK